MATTKRPNILVSAGTARREAAKRFKVENERRSQSVTLLNPDEVAGDIDASRLMSLTTTLHGMSTQLTLDDLRQFQANIRSLKKRFVGGLSARAMLDRSLKVDRDRANAEIHTAVPVSSSAGVIQIVTNAGPNSDVRRHHVHVELLNYSSVVASPRKASVLAKELLAGPARWQCSCGRFRYWYRYVFTILKSNYGASETAFPKIRNPELRGSCCKHMARVAHNMLHGGVFLNFAQKMIERGRADVTSKRVDASKSDVKQMVELAAAESARKRKIVDPKTPAEKRRATMMRKAKESMKETANKNANKKAQSTGARSSAEQHKIDASARILLAAGAITQAQYDKIVKGAGKK